MNMVIRGKAFVLGDNIDTDQIIPAKYLAYNPSDRDGAEVFRDVCDGRVAEGAERAAVTGIGVSCR